MRVNNMVFFASVLPWFGDEPTKESLILTSSRYPIPVFRSLHVHTTGATHFFHKGKELSSVDVLSSIRGYIEKPDIPLVVKAQLPDEAIKLLTILSETYLDGFWLKVSGEMVIEQGQDRDVLVDRNAMKQRQGDMDLPITTLAGWIFVIVASEIHFEVTPNWDYDDIEEKI